MPTSTAVAIDYPDWRAAHPDGRFTDWLRALNQPTWETVVEHRFTDELAAGTLDDAVFRRYLIQDYTFLNRFVKLVGFAIGTAPTLADRIPLAQFLGLVTSEENTYFQRSFDALGVPERDRLDPELLPPARGFRDLMEEAAQSLHYPDMLAVLVVAEWSYLSWASRVSGQTPSKFYLAEWITLHANPGFATFVDWLRGQLDREGPGLSAERRARVVDLFTRAVRLEQAFFDAAYG